MPVSDIALLVIALCQIAGVVAAVVIAPRIGRQLADALRELRQPLDSAVVELRETAQSARRSLLAVDMLLAEVRKSELLPRAATALTTANAAAGRLDPLADQMASTLGNARELLDDATQTSQSVRGLAEDLAATNKELAALSSALIDVVGELRDQELAAKLTNVLTDTSMLAADIGVLAENANAYLETGKPLLNGIGRVMGSARARAAALGTNAAALRAGVQPAAATPPAKPEQA